MNNSIFIPFLIFLALSERVFAIQIGGYNIGLFDLLLFIFLVLQVSKGKLEVPKYIIPFLFFFILSTLFNFILNPNQIAITSIITMPAKFILAVYLANNQKVNYDNSKIILLSYITLGILLLTISDAFLVNNYGILNRNETIVYMLSMVFLSDNKKHQKYLFFILIILAFIVKSRQLIVSSIFSIIFLLPILIKTSKKNILGLFLIIGLIIFSKDYFFQNLNEYEIRRFSFETNISERTRSDKIRLNNILWGIDKFTERPIIGHGTGSYLRNNPDNKVAHNFVITLLYENGIIGLLLFVLLLIKIRPPSLKNEFFQTYLFMTFIFGMLFIEVLAKLPFYLFLFKTEYLKKQINLSKTKGY